ncbi:hypothetical protein TanjilG_15907 [Lupinus angustifolius]|uniref:Uncharacterized protein n=1 Tax=Lupinus angustifolius TaxID=3871 RepID=A0A4P1RGK3_LUPAN|nr:hypothetical protein TanjilG_15907 [Lupinus angustifolius]
MSRSTLSMLPPLPAKPVPSHPGQLHPSSSVAQRALYMVNMTGLLTLGSPFSLPCFLICVREVF